MDQFGIGVGVLGAANVYFSGARRSGRTTALVETVRDGDRIIFLNPREAHRVQRLVEERGVKCECVVLGPEHAEWIFGRPPSEGRTIFDHTWVEAYYAAAIMRAGEEIDHFQRESSGYGEAHRATLRRARREPPCR